MRAYFPSFIFICSSALACPPVPEISEKRKNVPYCLGLKNETVKTGQTCQTKRGIVFRRVHNGWLDTSKNGLLWTEDIKQRVTQKEGEKFCKSKKSHLPSAEELRVAEESGFREILQLMNNHRNDYFYWSSTTLSKKGSAYGYSSSSRKIGVFLKSLGKHRYIVARCVQKK